VTTPTTSPRPLWRNWTSDQPCRPRGLLAAAGVSDVVAAVERAASEAVGLRAAGSGHSYNDIVHSDGYIVSIGAMGALLDVDRDTGLVRVEAGMKLGALHRHLHSYGLALPSLGEIDEQTVAGAIATDTHGSGLRFGSLSAQVASLQLVTADGSVIEVGDDDPETLHAASVGLGSLGIVTAVTLRCVPAFTLHQARHPERLDAVLSRLDSHADTHDHPGLFVFPYARRALVIERNRVSLPPDPRPAARAWLQDVLIENRFVAGVCRAAGRAPATTPALTRAMAALGRPDIRVDSSHRIFTGAVLFPVVSAEWGLPREAAAQAIVRLVGVFERDRFPVAMPFLCRWGAPSEAFLSPAHGRETFYLEVLAHTGVAFEPMLRATEDLMEELGGRPHWAKRFSVGAAELEPRYPGWERFAAARSRLDPEGRFANAFTERVLGPVRPRLPEAT